MDAWGGAGAALWIGLGFVKSLSPSWLPLMCIFAGTGLPRRGRRPAERVLLPGTGTCMAGRRRRAFAHRNLKSQAVVETWLVCAGENHGEYEMVKAEAAAVFKHEAYCIQLRTMEHCVHS